MRSSLPRAASSSGVAARPTMSDSPASRWTTAPGGRPGTLHNAGFLHRDVSPDNILIATDGRIRLIDFGATLPALKGSRENLPTILKTGYAPIEQHAQAEAQGSWTDLYALGATFYLCLTGEAIPEATDRILKDSTLIASVVQVVAFIVALIAIFRDRHRIVPAVSLLINLVGTPIAANLGARRGARLLVAHFTEQVLGASQQLTPEQATKYLSEHTHLLDEYRGMALRRGGRRL